MLRSTKPSLDRKKSRSSLTKSSPEKEKKKKKKHKKSSSAGLGVTDDPDASPTPKPSIKNPTDDAQNENLDRMNLLSANPSNLITSTSPSPLPIVTQITYKDQETQTDIKLSVVNDENDIAQVSKEVAEAHAQMIQSLRGQINKLNTEIADLQKKTSNYKTTHYPKMM